MESMKSDVMKTMVMIVTPELARMFLDSSIGNRQLREVNISEISGAIRRGEWRLTHQGISFDKEGHLRDGHHRMTACVLTGIPIKVMVTVGQDDESFKEIDRGAKRSFSDITGIDKRIAEPIRLATRIVYGATNCTPDRCLFVASSGLQSALEEIIAHCGTSRRFYTSSSMRLAAALRIMDGFNKDYVLRQYRALSLLDFDAMSSVAKALVRQSETNNLSSSNYLDTISRGICVFDQNKGGLSKIQISEESLKNTNEYIRRVIYHGLGVKS